MISDITIRFDNALRSKFKEKAEILNFLLKHDRKHLCIQNLCDQIIRAEKYSIRISVKTYDSVIKDVALFFAKACLQKSEEDHYSKIRISEIKAKESALKDAELILKDLEKDTINERGLTEIERDEVKQAIESRRSSEQVQA